MSEEYRFTLPLRMRGKNSLLVTIPAAIVKAENLKEGDMVDITMAIRKRKTD